MRRIARAALVLLWLACAPAWAQQLTPVPPLDSSVVDTTGTLDAAHRRQLEQQALDLQRRKGSQLQVLVVPTTRPEDIFDYSQRVFDQWQLGRKGVDDGVLVVVAMQDRRMRIHPGYGLEGAIPDATANRVIQEYMVPRFRAGDFGGGLVEATAVLVRLVDGEELPPPVSTHAAAGERTRGGDWVFALFAAFIVASIVRGLFGRLPAGIRGLFTGGAGGMVAWLLSSAVLVGGIGAVLGLIVGLGSSGPGRYARQGGWGGWSGGGGGWGGGGGGFGGGGWSGGGGMSGGGGASGSW